MGRRTRVKTDSILVDVGMCTESYLSVGWCRSCIRENCFSRCLMHPPNRTCLSSWPSASLTKEASSKCSSLPEAPPAAMNYRNLSHLFAFDSQVLEGTSLFRSTARIGEFHPPFLIIDEEARWSDTSTALGVMMVSSHLI